MNLPSYRDIKNNFGLESKIPYINTFDDKPPAVKYYDFERIILREINDEIPNNRPIPERSMDDIAYEC